MMLLRDGVGLSLVQLLVFVPLQSWAAAKKQPHVLLILADDLGWNDVGFHNSDIHTPHLDELARNGVTLDNYYVQPICTPSRSQLLSGRYQIHTGLQHGVIKHDIPNGLPLDLPTLADKLRDVGYSTHIVGKWHLGFFTEEYTPTSRGFDSFYGYLGGAEDYYTHTFKNGQDFWNDSTLVTDKNGTYSTRAFGDRAENIVKTHVSQHKERPLFLYLPFQAVHGPLQVPDYLEQYSTITDANRRIFAGMVSAMDEAIGSLISVYKESGIWDETVVVFSTDNGGHVTVGGSNWPLRGQKQELWEGGVRGVGLVHGPSFLQDQGTTYKGLLHISDWYPSLVKLAGGNIDDLSLDGYDVWEAISKGGESPRKELLHNIDPLYPLYGERMPGSKFDTRVRSAVRVGDWKLLTGCPSRMSDSATECTNVAEKKPTKRRKKRASTTRYTKKSLHKHTDKIFPGRRNRLEKSVNSEKNLWLFNIHEDPLEETDVSSEYPEMVHELLDLLAAYNITSVPVYYPPADPMANPKKHGGVWMPWRE